MTFFLVVLLSLFAINMPVAFAMLGTAIAFLLFTGDLTLQTIPQTLIGGMNSFILLAVPFFLLAGGIMNTGGITDRIFRFTQVLIGHIRGGLAHTTIVAECILSGISGSAASDAAGLAQVAIPGLERQGYHRGFSAALVAAAATIGPIIPPSIVLVIYGSLGGVSVGALLLGGILPGIVMAIILMATVAVIARRRGYPVGTRASWADAWQAFREAFWALLTPFVLLGGMVSGAFTPTEAGLVAAVYCLIVALFIYREMTWRGLWEVLVSTAVANAGIMLIIGAASSFAWGVTYEGVPQRVAEAVFGFSRTPWVVLLIINGVLLIAGMFMEGLAILTILIPVLRAIAVELNIDLVHFGLVVTLNLCIGGLTPPVGVISYIVCMMAKMSMTELVRELWPFLIALLISLLIITYQPWIVLLIPNLVFK